MVYLVTDSVIVYLRNCWNAYVHVSVFFNIDLPVVEERKSHFLEPDEQDKSSTTDGAISFAEVSYIIATFENLINFLELEIWNCARKR